MDDTILLEPPADLPRTLVAAYLARVRGAVPGLQEAIAQRDFATLRIFGHRLKGTGGAYGAPRLTEIGGKIERAAKDGDTTELHLVTGELRTYMNRIQLAAD